MRLNTIIFDANLPTTQQVNVPTNTDYKVGLKVKRNGEIQQLGPDEFTIYTGETTAVEEQMCTTQETLAYASYSYSRTETIPADMDGMEVDANDVVFQLQQNGEWTSIPQAQASMAQTYDPYVKVKDGDTVLYTCHFKDYPRQWVASDGSLTQTVKFESGKTLQISIYSANCFNPPITGAEQNIVVRVAVSGRREEKTAIPTDADKTNGYVTFTQASGDDPNFRQLDVVVHKPIEYSNTASAESTVTGQRTNLNISLDLSAFAGMELTPENIKLEYLSGDTYVEVQPAPAQTNTGCYIAVNGSPVAFWQDGKFWAYDTDWYSFDTLTLPEGATFNTGSIQGRYTTGATISYPATFKASVGHMVAQPGYIANFKLNVNEFKSQQGDISTPVEIPEMTTRNFSGTFADGTEFSYDVYVKEG